MTEKRAEEEAIRRPDGDEDTFLPEPKTSKEKQSRRGRLQPSRESSPLEASPPKSCRSCVSLYNTLLGCRKSSQRGRSSSTKEDEDRKSFYRMSSRHNPVQSPCKLTNVLVRSESFPDKC